jgi:DNA-binding LytR/AlgR family response regulator
MTYDGSLSPPLDRFDRPDRLREIRPFHVVEGGRSPSPALRGRESLEPALRVVARRKRNLVFLEAADVWAFEADARLAFVHAPSGRFDVDVSLAEIEACPFGSGFARVHRSWLVNLAHVKELELEAGMAQLFVGDRLGDAGCGIHVPVARDLVRSVRETLLASAIGLRRRDLEGR